MTDPTQKFTTIRKGLLEFLILQTDFATQEGTLYPLLSKMRREELVDYEWQESETGPPRKYYKLTDKGRSQLGEFKSYWDYLNTTINQLGRGS
jgi:PadR family transcriptional regulator PadR